MINASRRMGELLVDQRLLTKDALETLLAQESETGRPLAKLLVEEGHVREIDLLKTVADQVGMEFVDLDEVLFNPDLVSLITGDVAKSMRAVPVREQDGRVVVAVTDPFDPEKHRQLEQAFGRSVILALTTNELVERAQGYLYGSDGADAPDAAATPEGEEEVHANEFLRLVVEAGGSDLHLTAGSPPQIRVNGSLRPIEGYGMLMPAELRRMIYGILTEAQRDRLEETLELDASHPVPGLARFRMNVFFQRDAIGAVFRSIPEQIKTLEALGVPQVLAEFGDVPRGLVLVTGPTGSGKSTTLASIIDLINRNRACHIITVEDPIEFLHKHQRALVNQREVGSDTHSFTAALKHALRQDPDVILVGEMRDLETISTALTAAETGHLVFGTLHTQDTAQTIDRIIDVFPSHQQQQIRVQLAATIQGVVTQQLVSTRDRQGRIPACEVMVATPAIRNLIREAKNHQIPTALQAGGKFGMQTMDQALAELVRLGRISYETAVERCSNVEDLERLVNRVA